MHIFKNLINYKSLDIRFISICFKTILLTLFIGFSGHTWAYDTDQTRIDHLIRDVRFDDVPNVKKALSEGLSPNTIDKNGNSILAIAIKENAKKVAKLLIDTPKVDLDRPNLAGETPVMMAAFNGSLDLLSYMVEKYDVELNKPKWSALHYAALNGHLDVCKYLLEHGAYVDPQSPNGSTPLMLAARAGHIQIVKLLLDSGAALDSINAVGMTAIDFAIQGNQTEIANGLKSRWLKLYGKSSDPKGSK